jgi:hypothetical protein
MDAKSKITPGPWQAKPENAYQPAQVFGEDLGRPVADVFGIDKDTRKANARAIAAVPDLIAALEHALRDVKCRIHMLPVDGGIEGAILKAQSERYEAALAKAGA